MVIHCTMSVVMIDRKRLFFSVSWPHAGSEWMGRRQGDFFCIGPSNGKRLGVILTNVVVRSKTVINDYDVFDQKLFV